MNRDYPLAESPNPGPKKNLLPVKRVYEIADSLNKSYESKTSLLRGLAKKNIKLGEEEKAYMSGAVKDWAESYRLKTLADMALKKKK
jgi:hypothetical protein